jgi:hypothetical protein
MCTGHFSVHLHFQRIKLRGGFVHHAYESPALTSENPFASRVRVCLRLKSGSATPYYLGTPKWPRARRAGAPYAQARFFLRGAYLRPGSRALTRVRALRAALARLRRAEVKTGKS